LIAGGTRQAVIASYSAMGIFNTLFQIGKARMISRILGRTIGGRLGTGLMIAYFGKKAFDQYQARKRRSLAPDV
jgi:hypothetical protein